MSLYRYEICPIDLGITFDDTSFTCIERILRDNGWIRIDDAIPDSLAVTLAKGAQVWQQDHIQLYIPHSGWAVACYTFCHCDGTMTATQIGHALISRAEHHDTLPMDDDLTNLVDHIRSLEDPVRTTKEGHEYAVTVWEARNWDSDTYFDALVNPREYGLEGLSTHNLQPHDISRLITTAETPGQDAVEYGDDARLWSSWSAVLVATNNTTDVVPVLLVEMRVQSAWLASEHASRVGIAAHRCRNASATLHTVEDALLEIDRIEAGISQRLGIDAPTGPTKILNNIRVSSDLDRQFTDARISLNSARAQLRHRLERRRDQSRRLVEVFSLVFASSGLASLLFEIPLTIDSITTAPVQFGFWIVATVLGIVLVYRS